MIKVKDKNSLIGVELLVIEAPKYWDSYLNKNYPRRLDFPRLVTLIEIDKLTDSATCGNYGWSLDTLLEVAEYAAEKSANELRVTFKKKQVTNQINEKLEEIKEQLLKNCDSLINSGCLPDEYLKDENYLLTMALFNNLCETNPFAPKSKQTKKEFENINKFL
jgi:hypothetical protein